MPISFNQIPASWRVPGAFIEIDNSRAFPGLSEMNARILVIGQRLSTGTVAANVLQRITNVKQAAEYWGVGSMMHNLFEVLKLNNRVNEAWGIALDDASAGVKATGSVKFGGPATANGTLNLYIAGRRIQVGVLKDNSAEDIAAAVIAKIAEDPTLPVTAAVDGEDATQVNLTAQHKGAYGNDIDIRINYRGDLGGEKTPDGVTVTITAMSDGATNPDISAALAALPDDIYNLIVMPYTDSANLDALHEELESRWGPLRMLEGFAFAGRKGTHSQLGTFGDSQNSPFISVMGLNGFLHPPYEVAAAVAGRVAFAASNDPARPFHTLELKGILPPPLAARFTLEERNLLLYDGISTFNVTRDGRVRIERLITTYKTNEADVPDRSYLNVNTMLQLAYLRQDLRIYVYTKFIVPRFKLANDGVRVGSGQRVATPSMIKDDIIARYSLWEYYGLVENINLFKQELIVERDGNDPDRVNALLTPDLMNQLRIFAAQIQFLL